jgi:glycosyltransferase involved in cell wall biosynthesis
MSTSEPLVTCICVTRKRQHLLKRAIDCFHAQTYPNKELLIVYEDDDLDTKSFLRSLASSAITTMEVERTPDTSLGRLRNTAVQSCKGDYFCQWDDDDWYHQRRLEFQLQVIKESGLPACLLLHWLIFDCKTSKAYISPFWPWEGSLLCRTKVINDDIRYEDLKRKEDTPLIQKLLKRHSLFPIMMPKLYIYVYHGGNVWGYDHWENNIINKSKELSESSSRMIADLLNSRTSVREGSEFLDQMTG